MNCIILAAGYALRMYPLTKDKPKPLLPVAGKPILDHILAKVSDLDVARISIVSNATFYPNFQLWHQNLQSDLKNKITILNDGTTSNENRKGAIGDLHFALSSMPEDDTLVIAGDNLFSFPLTDLKKAFSATNSPTIAVRDLYDKSKVAGKFGVVALDKKNKIIEFQEKPKEPKSTLASTALYILPKDSIADLNQFVFEIDKPDNLGNFISWLSAKRSVYGFVFDAPWHDIGSLEEYESLQDLKEFK